MLLAYDGTEYQGWQTQKHGDTVQARLIHALSKMAKTPVQVTAAGRTDAGVHPLGQCVHFALEHEIPAKGILMGANSILPDDIRVLDAVGKLEVNELFNLWLGRFLPPSDLSNLSGPFYLNAYEFPYVQFGYPGILQGRDDGAAIWGQVGEGAFKWQVGMFKGTDGFPNGDDHRMLTARLTLNLLDPEPGYYNQSTYYGEKDILALGVAMMNQNDATGTIADPEDYLGWNIDVLFEKKLDSDGVLSLESAYYDFDDNGANNMEIAAGDLVDMNRQGESFFILAAYLFPDQVAMGNIEGQFQPYFRFMDFDRDFPANGETEEGLDFGLNYIIDGHNAQISVVYGRREPGPGAGNYDLVRIAAQLQF